MKKCPPGVICVENVTLFLLFIILFVLGFFIYSNTKQNIIVNDRDNITIENKQVPSGNYGNSWFGGFLPSWPYTNMPKDVLLNPYAAPYRDERYFVPELNYVPPSAVPINVSTNIGAVDTTYRQMGIMTPLNGVSKDNILPLMGRPLFTNRDKWQYYTISNQHNNVKLPVSFKGRSALNDYGVDQIFSGDTVYVEGYNDAFKVTVYENDTIKYLPFV
jgi:hypothetical protein